MRSTLFLTVALCVLSACASAPKIDYYTLGMESSGRVDSAINISVERLRTTEALGRSQIMVLASPTRVDYYATSHWAGSVGEQVQQKLTAEFGPTVDGRRTLVVSGKVLACEQVDGPGGAEARVKLEIAVRDAEVARYQPAVLEKSYASRRSVSGSNPGSVVEGLSRCVEEIAAEIADDLSALYSRSRVQPPYNWDMKKAAILVGVLAAVVVLQGCASSRGGVESSVMPRGWPVPYDVARISSAFGEHRGSSRHKGLDLTAPKGTKVRATADGRVTFAGRSGDFGRLVIVGHSNGYETRYAHLKSISVNKGKMVKRGAVIGTVGESGNATGPHLHYEVRLQGTPVNPRSYL